MPRGLQGAAYAAAQALVWLFAGPVAIAAAALASMGSELSLPLVLAASPPAVVIGAGPALVAASLDGWLRAQGTAVPWRIAGIAAFAALVAGLLIAPLFRGFIEEPASPVRFLPFLLCASAGFGGAVATVLSMAVRRFAKPSTLKGSSSS